MANGASCDPAGTVPSNISKGQAGFGGGNGSTAETAWKICHIDQLRAIETNAQTMSAYYILESDLDFSNILSWRPLGPKDPITITNATGNGSQETITTATNHGFSVNQRVWVYNMNPEGYNTDAFTTVRSVPSPTTFTVTGNTTSAFTSGGRVVESNSFTGNFNGNFRTLKNLAIGGDRIFYGLFAELGTGAVVNRIHFENATVVGGGPNSLTGVTGSLPAAGVLAGTTATTTISEIFMTSPSITGAFQAAGFLLGDGVALGTAFPVIRYVKVTNGYMTSSFQSAIANPPSIKMGGIFGSGSANFWRVSVGGQLIRGANAAVAMGGVFGSASNTRPIVNEAHSAVTLDGNNSAGVVAIGGINGQNITTISNSIFEGTVTRPSSSFLTGPNPFYVGGISGINKHFSLSAVSKTLVTTAFPYTTRANAGPILGENLVLQQGDSAGPTDDSYYDSTLNASYAALDTGANEFGIPAATSDLKTLSTFTNAGWAIVDASSAAATTNWAIYLDPSDAANVAQPIWKITQDANTANNTYPSLIWMDYWPKRITSPQNLVATSSTAGVAELSWSAPSGTISGYKVESSSDGGNTWVVESLNTGSSSSQATVSGLTPGATYRFRVTAYSSDSFSSPNSIDSNALLMGSDPTAPQNLSAVRLGENSFRISWDPPSNTGGLSITSYTLQVDKGSGFETVAHTGTSAEITGVTINSLWSFRVLATNVVGSSSFALYTNTPPVPYSGPIVTSFSAREVVADRANSVTLDGMRLSQVTELFIGATKLTFTRSAAGQLVVSLPALAKGVYDLRMVYTGGGVITHQAAFTALDALVVLPSRTLLFTNFAGDGFRLPAAASRGIRSAVSSLGSASKIVCVGSTSGTRATASDRRLALRRAQEACNLAKRLVPGVVTEVRANPASGIGARFRSVTVQIVGQ